MRLPLRLRFSLSGPSDRDPVATTVEVRDEAGSVVGPGWDSVLSIDLSAVSESDARCLRFVDPYGDTVFNSLQVPVLVQELTAILPRLGPSDRDAVQSLLAFVAEQPDWIHRYLVFVGD